MSLGRSKVIPQITLLKNIGELLTLQPAAAKQGRRVQEADLGLLKKHSVVSLNGKIVWIGPHSKLPKHYAHKKLREFDMKGKTVLPGFVECHTHSVFAGSRAAEFEMRNQGASYQEIAANGGGIISTMRQTREASLPELTRSLQKRVDFFVQQGVTTLEIKSGYALNKNDELKMLSAIGKIKNVRTVATFLGAHSLPPEFKSSDEYLQYLADEVLPVVREKKLASRVDIFIEKGFFSSTGGSAYLKKAKTLGFDILIHADQMTLCGGSELAIEMMAASGDHLLQVTDSEIGKLAKSDVTCVLLPASDLYMKCKYPEARKMIDAGARVALATDFNPGTSPTQDLALVGLLARLQMKMSLPEVIAAYTVGGAHALRLASQVGSIELEKSADFVCTEKSWSDLFYSVGDLGAELVLQAGNVLHQEI